MAQTFTLEEAANRLGITPEDLKRKLKTEWTHVRSFRDGPTLRFRATDVDELARSLGAASDPGLQLAPMPEAPNPGSDDFKVSDAPAAPKSSDEPLSLSLSSGSDDDIFSLSAEEPKPGPKSGKHDSDVRLGSQSSGKLKPGKKEGDPAQVPTEEITLDLGGPGSAVIKGGGSSAKLSAPKSSGKLTGGDSGKKLSNPGVGDSSEFELSLDADSSDFELQLNTDSSDEVALGELPKDKGGKRGGGSGINLRSPADSGINLEKKGKGKPPPAETDSDEDFELSLEAPSPSGAKLGGPKSSGPKSGKAPPPADSDSEFELTLDDSGEGSSLEAAALESAEAEHKDIFETDFEIPPMSEDSDSGSEAVALESDTDLAIDDVEPAPADETGSEVVVLEDEEEAGPVARKGGRSGRGRALADVDGGDVDLADVEVDDEADAATALRGTRKRHADDEDEDEEREKVVVVAQPAPWGFVPVLFLFPALIFTLLGGLMGYELLHTMWGYQQTKKPTAPLTREVAKALELDIKDQ